MNTNPDLDLADSLNNFLSSQNDFLRTEINLFDNLNIECKYYDESSLVASFSGINNPLILNANIQSLSSKFNRLSEMISILGNEDTLFDIIALQEIWDIKDLKSLALPGYHELVFKSRSNARGGGVGFYIREGLNFKVIDELSLFNESIFESLCVEIEFPNKRKMLFVSLYRPPSHKILTLSQQSDAYLEMLDFLLTSLSQFNFDSFILTDSNIDLLSLNHNNLSSKYLQSILSHGFLNIIHKSTFFSKYNHSLIDHILTNSHALSFISGVLTQDISDHCFTFCSINLKKEKVAKVAKNARSFSDFNTSKFYESLSNIGWSDVLDCQDPENAYNIFWDLFSTLFNLHFPLRRVNFNKNFHKLNSFMSTGLLTSRRKKLELYKLYLSDKTALNFSNYKSYRNLFNKLIKASKKLHYENELQKNQKDPKAMWKILNESINRSSSKNSFIKEIFVNNILHNDSVDIANEFNKFFSEIANDIRVNIPSTLTHPESFTDPLNLNFDFSLCSPEIVYDIIMSLETKTSLDIDNLNTKVLKKVANLIASPLSHVFNLSLQMGILPDRLKISRTVPVFKAGKTDNLSNYRPISCLPVMSKIIEKFVSKQLFEFISSNQILYKYQFGFQPGKSTAHPLLHIVDFISKAFNNDEFVIAVFLDFQKAFDLVDHKILLKKLCNIGVRGIALKWFESYLKDRKQFVMVNGKISKFFKTINISVLQGSILGPLLFLIFINDMHKSNALLNVHFADDTTGLCKGKKLNEMVPFVNQELQKIGVWLRSHKLSINAGKTKVMIFHPRGKNVDQNLNFVFDNNDLNCSINPDLIHPVERIKNSSTCPAYKVLGIFIDENLTFDYHVKSTLNKISKSLFTLNKVKNSLSSTALKSLYYALIHPYFLYCLPVISCSSQKNINTLALKQKRCIRIICKASYNAHTEPLFHSLKILPLADLILQQKLNFMHSIEYCYAPSSFIDNKTFPKNSQIDVHPYPLRNINDFFTPRVRNEFLTRFPFYSFSICWNTLDPSFQSISNKNVFKYSVKQHLLDRLENFVCNKLFCYTCSSL